MLSQSQRTTILELRAKGVNKREIAKLLNLSRQSVRKVLAANSTAVPKIEREEKAAPYRQRILELLHTCKGNWVCQLELAHFDALIWPTLKANDLSGAGWSGALRRRFCGALGRSGGRCQKDQKTSSGTVRDLSRK